MFNAHCSEVLKQKASADFTISFCYEHLVANVYNYPKYFHRIYRPFPPPAYLFQHFLCVCQITLLLLDININHCLCYQSWQLHWSLVFVRCSLFRCRDVTESGGLVTLWGYDQSISGIVTITTITLLQCRHLLLTSSIYVLTRSIPDILN